MDCHHLHSRSLNAFHTNTLTPPYIAGRMSTDEAAVRFLLQSTFGASRADVRAFKQAHPLGGQSTIRDTNTRLFQAWIDKQVMCWEGW